VAELTALPEARQLAPELVARTVVADIDSVPVGFVTVVASGEVHEIEELFVEPSRWRSGFGGTLVQEAIQRAAGEGATTMRVIANRRAQAFYERCGFAVVGEFLTQFEPAPVMERKVA
jgi:GNAT superfamily N-acetyltransferase